MRRYKKLLAINQLSLFNYLAHFAIYPATGMSCTFGIVHFK